MNLILRNVLKATPLLSLALLLSCSRSAGPAQEAIKPVSVPTTSGNALAGVSSGIDSRPGSSDNERIKVPFAVAVNWQISLGSGRAAAVEGDLANSLKSALDAPSHPKGSVSELKVSLAGDASKGRSIPLLSSKLEDGLLSTKDFGKVEFAMLTLGGSWEMRATRLQISKIQSWLENK